MTTKKKAASKPAPAAPEDDYAGFGNAEVDEDVVITTVGGGEPIMVPASMRRLPPDSREIVRDLQTLVGRRMKLAYEIDAVVEELRSRGVSWALIGWTTGLTGEAARLRWMVRA